MIEQKAAGVVLNIAVPVVIVANDLPGIVDVERYRLAASDIERAHRACGRHEAVGLDVVNAVADRLATVGADNLSAVVDPIGDRPRRSRPIDRAVLASAEQEAVLPAAGVDVLPDDVAASVDAMRERGNGAGIVHHPADSRLATGNARRHGEHDARNRGAHEALFEHDPVPQGLTPVPVSVTMTGTRWKVVVMPMAPGRNPAAVGPNVTVTVQDAPGSSGESAAQFSVAV